MSQEEVGVNAEKYVAGNVRFGSLAALLGKFSLMSGFGGRADVRDERPAIRHQVVRRYSPVQHMPLIGLLVYFLH